MAYAVPIEVYEAIKKVIKDEKLAQEVVKTIEKSLETIENKAREEKVVLKAEIKDELRKELATKEDIALLEEKMQSIRQEMQTIREELRGEIKELRVYIKFLIIFLVVFLTLLNPQFYEAIKTITKLIAG